jgi:hypothetical protein
MKNKRLIILLALIALISGITTITIIGFFYSDVFKGSCGNFIKIVYLLENITIIAALIKTLKKENCYE